MTLLDAYLYRGRHRAPVDHATARRAATLALLVPAGGTVLAAPAAAGPNWGPVIACESSGRNVESYNESSASGYFQIINATWREHGGLAFAPRAIGATKDEQERVADDIFEARGLQPWDASRHCWGDKRAQILAGDGDAVDTGRADRREEPRVEESGTAIPDGYRVKRGDTLNELAARFKVPGGYREIASVNNIPNPDVILVGQRLR